MAHPSLSLEVCVIRWMDSKGVTLKTAMESITPTTDGEAVVPITGDDLESLRNSCSQVSHLLAPKHTAIKDRMVESKGASPHSNDALWVMMLDDLHANGVISPELKKAVLEGNDKALIYFLNVLYNSFTAKGEGGGQTSPSKLLKPQTSSVKQFLMASLCKDLQVRPEQALALVTTGRGYLNHIIVNGIKDNFEPVARWIQNIFTNADALIPLLKSSEESLTFIYGLFAAGLESNCAAVAFWSCRTLSKVGFHFSDQEITWQWFISGDATHSGRDVSGVSACIQCYKRHPDTKLALAPVFSYFAKKKLFHFINSHLRDICGSIEGYYSFLHDFLPALAERKDIREMLTNGGTVELLAEECIKSIHPSFTLGIRVSAVCLLSEIWLSFSDWIDQINEMPTRILQCLKKSSRDKDVSLQLISIGSLLSILESFAVDHHKFAPYVYKTIIFLLVENRSEEPVRELLMSNLINILQKLKYIPITVLAGPLVKQTSIHGYNTLDFELFIVLAKHPRLDIGQALLMLDLLGRVSLNDPAFCRSAAIPFLILAQRFSNNASFLTCIANFTKVALSLMGAAPSPKEKEAPAPVPSGKKKDKGNKKGALNIRRTLAYEILAKILALGDRFLSSTVLNVMDNYLNEKATESIPGLKEFVTHFQHVHIEDDDNNMADSIVPDGSDKTTLFHPLHVDLDEPSNLYSSNEVDSWANEVVVAQSSLDTSSVSESALYFNSKASSDERIAKPKSKPAGSGRPSTEKRAGQRETSSASDGGHSVKAIRNQAAHTVSRESLADKDRSKSNRETLKIQIANKKKHKLFVGSKKDPRSEATVTDEAEEHKQEDKFQVSNDLLKEFHRPIKCIIESYSKLATYKIGIHNKTMSDLIRQQKTIRIPEWLKIGSDFALVPFLIDRTMLLKIYNNAVTNETREMAFQEFCIAICTVASLANFSSVSSSESSEASESSPVMDPQAKVAMLMQHMRDAHGAFLADDEDGSKRLRLPLTIWEKSTPSPRKYRAAGGESEAMRCSLEILDSILYAAIGTHLLPPGISKSNKSPSKPSSSNHGGSSSASKAGVTKEDTVRDSPSKVDPTRARQKVKDGKTGEKVVEVYAFGATHTYVLPSNSKKEADTSASENLPPPKISYKPLRPVVKTVVRVEAEKEVEAQKLAKLEADRKKHDEAVKKRLAKLLKEKQEAEEKARLLEVEAQAREEEAARAARAKEADTKLKIAEFHQRKAEELEKMASDASGGEGEGKGETKPKLEGKAAKKEEAARKLKVEKELKLAEEYKKRAEETAEGKISPGGKMSPTGRSSATRLPTVAAAASASSDGTPTIRPTTSVTSSSPDAKSAITPKRPATSVSKAPTKKEAPPSPSAPKEESKSPSKPSSESPRKKMNNKAKDDKKGQPVVPDGNNAAPSSTNTEESDASSSAAKSADSLAPVPAAPASKIQKPKTIVRPESPKKEPKVKSGERVSPKKEAGAPVDDGGAKKSTGAKKKGEAKPQKSDSGKTSGDADKKVDGPSPPATAPEASSLETEATPPSTGAEGKTEGNEIQKVETNAPSTEAPANTIGDSDSQPAPASAEVPASEVAAMEPKVEEPPAVTANAPVETETQ